MRTGKHRAHEDFQVCDIDVFYNGNLIVAGFFSSVILGDVLSVSIQRFLQDFPPNVLSSVLHLLCVIFNGSRVNKWS